MKDEESELLAADGAAAYYEYTARFRGAAYYTAFLDALPDTSARVLDAGCGGGKLTLMLAKHAQWVIGLDLSFTLLSIGRTRQRARAQTNVTWVCGDLHQLSFEPASFDCITSANVLHLTELPVVVRQLPRLLKPGGRLVISDLVLAHPHAHVILLRYAYRTAAAGVQLMRMYGGRTAWRFLRWRLTPESIKSKVVSRRLWTAASLTAHLSEWFPGCRIESGRTNFRMEWDKPKAEG